mmetsp:Transcript_42738/g.133957  ORF Transcript_42738/g.133957 Transcript_42738/m.133957 type:complete len:204 (+) Transcript_42738:420-1031(+)
MDCDEDVPAAHGGEEEAGREHKEGEHADDDEVVVGLHLRLLAGAVERREQRRGAHEAEVPADADDGEADDVARQLAAREEDARAQEQDEEAAEDALVRAVLLDDLPAEERRDEHTQHVAGDSRRGLRKAEAICGHGQGRRGHDGAHGRVADGLERHRAHKRGLREDIPHRPRLLVFGLRREGLRLLGRSDLLGAPPVHDEHGQ